MKRQLPYVAFALVLSITAFYGNGYVWSSTLLEFNATTDAFYANWTQPDWVDPYAFNVTIGNNASSSAWMVFNVTNATPIKASTSDLADMIVNNNTAIANQVNISSFGTANVTIRFNASLLKPGRYTGNMTIVNSTNANARINNITMRLDVPLTMNTTYFRSNSFFGNVSSLNRFDVFFFNLSTANGLYVNVNDSRVDLLLFDDSNVLVATNNTNSSGNKTLLYAAPAHHRTYQLKVFFNTTNASLAVPYNGLVEFSSLNSSQKFLDFGSVNASPDAVNPTKLTFNINNTAQVNYTAVTETKQLSRVEIYTNAQNSTNFTVPIAGNYLSFDVTLEWNNASSDFNLTIYNSSANTVSIQNKRTDMFNVTGLGFNHIFSRATANINEFNKSWVVSVKGDPLAYYNLTIKINIGTGWLNSSFGNYTAYYVLNATQNSTTIEFNASVPQLSTEGIYNGTLTYRADTGHYTTIPFGINVTTPMLTVNNSFSQILLLLTDNIGSNKTLDYTFFVNNTGSYVLNLNDTNSTSLNNSGSNTIGFNYSLSNSVAARSSTLLKVRMNITTLAVQAGESVYYGWIKLNATNAHPYKEFLINMTLNLTNKLNVITSGVANQTDKGVWINPINKTVNYTHLASAAPVFINATVNVTFQNGTFVSGLNSSNFTAWLQQEFLYENSNYTLNFTDVNVSSVIEAAPNQNNYVLNLSVPSTIAGGNYSVFVSAFDGSSAFRNSGTGRFNYLYVNSSALVIDLTNKTHDSDDFYVEGTRDVFVNITNVGGGALFNVSVELSVTGSCTAVAGGYTAAYNIGNLSGFKSYSNTSATWKISIGSNSTCTITAVGAGPPGVWILNDSMVASYKGFFLSPGSTTGPSGGGTSTPALAIAIGTDKAAYLKADTVSFNFTVTSSSVKIAGSLIKYNITDPAGIKLAEASCTTNSSGQCAGSYVLPADKTGAFKISALASKDTYTPGSASKAVNVSDYAAAITAYEKTIYVLQGNSNTTKVTVRNSGPHAGAFALAIKDLEAAWWNVSQKNAAINAGQSADFDVRFDVPADAVVKNYTAKYSVSVNAEVASDYLYLVVMPTEKTKAAINATLANYTAMLNSLIQRFNETKPLAGNSSDINITEEKINGAAAAIANAMGYLSRGDFVRANELAMQAKIMIDTADALLKAVETSQSGKRLNNIIIAVGAVVALGGVGIVVYMMMPAPGYSARGGYTPPENAGEAGKVKGSIKKIVDKAEEIIDKIKEKIAELSSKGGGDYRLPPSE